MTDEKEYDFIVPHGENGKNPEFQL
jgi:hypothetical protein